MFQWKVADPACGDGAFLKEALRCGASAVAGIDIDPEAIEFIIHAVVGLPRDTFKDMGTSAKTAVLYLGKRKPLAGHRTILAEVSELALDGRLNLQLQTVVAAVHQPQPHARSFA